MKKLAIVGASGLVGQSVLKVLDEENLTKEFELFLVGSSKSVGNVLRFNNKEYALLELSEEIFNMGLDYAIFVTGEDVSRIWVEKFAKHGIVVIDNSSAFRLKEGIPLVVPEINLSDIKKNDNIIANPNCSTIQLVVVLDRLKKLANIDTVVVSSYQSVSGAGREALIDLETDSREIFEKGIRDNIIAKIGQISENKNCSEENKIILESKKILKEDFNIVATTVRVPIRYCHGESVYVKFKEKININKIKKILKVSYIQLSDDLFYPKDCVGTNLTYICRLRQHSENEILFFVIADNLRRGASFNAVEILKQIQKKD